MNKQDFQDMLSYRMEQRLKGRKGRNWHIDIDFMRKNFGRKSQKKCSLFPDTTSRIPDTTIHDPSHAFDFEQIIRPLDERGKIVLRMRFILGFDMDDIGRALGVSVSRVSQELAVLLSVLRGIVDGKFPQRKERRVKAITLIKEKVVYRHEVIPRFVNYNCPERKDKESLDESIGKLFASAFFKNKMNRTDTSKELGISIRTVRKYVRKYIPEFNNHAKNQ